MFGVPRNHSTPPGNSRAALLFVPIQSLLMALPLHFDSAARRWR